VGETMFLHLVNLYGFMEAKYWAQVLGLDWERPCELLDRLFYGPKPKPTVDRVAFRASGVAGQKAAVSPTLPVTSL
jgi:hypothetical protein